MSSKTFKFNWYSSLIPWLIVALMMVTASQYPLRASESPAKPQTKAQGLATLRARHLALHSRVGHVMMHLGFGEGNFEGAGMTTSSRGYVPTCTPCGRRACHLCRSNSPRCVTGARVVGDSIFRNTQTGARYRVRIWKR